MTVYVNIKIPSELSDSIDQITERHLKGYRNRGEFVADAIRKKLDEFKEELSKSRFTHLNVFEDRVLLADNARDITVEVSFRNDRAYCSLCEKYDCEHTQFALKLPKVEKTLRDQGWIIEDGRVVR